MEYENNDIEIGPARPGDERGIAAVHKETWIKTYPNPAAGFSKSDVLSMAKDFDSPESIESWKDKIFTNGENQNYVCAARDRDKVVAFCCAKKFENYNQLSAIYILPQYQGRGIGKRLFANVRGWLGREKKIIVTPVAYNLPAIGFYEKMGFAVIKGKSSAKKMPGGRTMPLIEMELMLSAI